MMARAGKAPNSERVSLRKRRSKSASNDVIGVSGKDVARGQTGKQQMNGQLKISRDPKTKQSCIESKKNPSMPTRASSRVKSENIDTGKSKPPCSRGNQLHTQKTYRPKRLKIRSLDFENNTSPKKTEESKSNSACQDESLLNLSLPTPLPPGKTSVYSQDLMDSSSDEEDLPEGITPMKVDRNFEENSVVWMKWKKWPYLPALVKKVYKDKKRMTCRVFGPNELLEDFTLGYGKPDNVIPFCDPRKTEIMASAQMLNKVDKDYFNACIVNAENFLLKETSKKLEESGLWKHTDELSASFQREPESDKEDELVPEKKKRKLSRDSDCFILNDDKKKHCMSKRGQERIEKKWEKTKPLTQFLLSSITKEYLEKILRGTEPSELHEKFCTCSIRERAKMKHRGFGPIDDDSQIEQLLSQYVTWVQELNKELRKPIHEINYVFDVWIPEAIVFALKKQKGYSTKRALEQFNKGVRRSKEELRLFHEELL